MKAYFDKYNNTNTREFQRVTLLRQHLERFSSSYRIKTIQDMEESFFFYPLLMFTKIQR